MHNCWFQLDFQSQSKCPLRPLLWGYDAAEPQWETTKAEEIAGESALQAQMRSIHALYCCVILKVVTAAKDVYHDYQD